MDLSMSFIYACYPIGSQRNEDDLFIRARTAGHLNSGTLG
jgi:hypothetical protein